MASVIKYLLSRAQETSRTIGVLSILRVQIGLRALPNYLIRGVRKPVKAALATELIYLDV